MGPQWGRAWTGRDAPMGEAKVGEEFITHEFDEAIAIQQVDRRRRDDALDEAPRRQCEAGHQVEPDGRREVPRASSRSWASRTTRPARSRTSPAGSRSSWRRRSRRRRRRAPTATSTRRMPSCSISSASRWTRPAGMLAIARDQKDTELRDAATRVPEGAEGELRGPRRPSSPRTPSRSRRRRHERGAGTRRRRTRR